MKHKFEGIGEATAAAIVAGLSANPELAFLTVGFSGKIIFFLGKLLGMALASMGLITLNVGAAKIETIVSETGMDEAWSDADAMIEKIRNTGRELTDEEIKAIDEPVKSAFRKFGRFGRLRKRGSTKL